MTLEGKRVLVVEDEYMIAADLKRALRDEGAQVVGPAGNLAKGLALAQEERLDAAILDLNLEGTFSYPIADRLDAAGVPYMLLTGYDAWAVPDAYSGKPTVAKPYAVPMVVAAVRDLCRQGERT